jgi:hypothetical protein
VGRVPVLTARTRGRPAPPCHPIDSTTLQPPTPPHPDRPARLWVEAGEELVEAVHQRDAYVILQAAGDG